MKRPVRWTPRAYWLADKAMLLGGGLVLAAAIVALDWFAALVGQVVAS